MNVPDANWRSRAPGLTGPVRARSVGSSENSGRTSSGTYTGRRGQGDREREEELLPRRRRPSLADLRTAVAGLRQEVRLQTNRIDLDVEGGAGEAFVRVLDSRTGEVLRQVPSDQIAALTVSVQRMSGVVIDNRA
jgi:uncharacterized FlaG/YvyC family protein